MNDLKENLILRDYLFYYLYGFDWRKSLEGRFKVKGNTLNKQILEVLPIKCPSLEKQREIVIKLDRVFSEIESLKSQIGVKQASVVALRQSLLSEAFAEIKGVA
jgi:restriction endonuclease S subunit